MEEGKLTRGAGAGQPEQAGVQNGQLALEFPPTENEKEQEAVVEAVLFTMGRSVELRQLAAAIGQGIREAGGQSPFQLCDNLEQVEEWLKREAKNGDCILFKGSNSMKLGEAVAEFMGQN